MTTSLQGTDDEAGFGVQGVAVAGDGVIGTTQARDRVGARGIHTGHINGIAVRGEPGLGEAVVQGVTGNGSRLNNVGDAMSGCGVRGDSSNGPGVSGTSSVGPGVKGEGTVGVLGVSSDGTAQGELTVGGFAGFFVGEVGVTGDLNVNGTITATVGCRRSDPPPVTAASAAAAALPGSHPVHRQPRRRTGTACRLPRTAGHVPDPVAERIGVCFA
jgi:hypothetical protein